uniref:Clathrin binding box of aftiphilin containing 1 n=1 Tax=Microcebus murinus TaxID=30608 RepID=A0A8C5XM26_MICMU
MCPEPLPGRSARPGGSEMQGPLESGAQSWGGRAGPAGDGALREAPGRRSGDDVGWARTRASLLLRSGKASTPRPGEGSTCTPGLRDPAEHSTWGEFEGFRESSAEAGQFPQSFQLPQRPADPQPPRTASTPEECGSPTLCQGGPWVTGAAVAPPSEPLLSYEDIFKIAFQEVSVPQATEDVSTLHHFLEISSEEKPGLESVHKFCSESRALWRALQNTNATSVSRCLWNGSHCQENYFLVLGIDAARKGLSPQSLSAGQGHVAEGSDLKEPEGLLAVSSFRLHHCKALIQTKLSGPPGSRQGGLITYSLFLKTPLCGHRQYITIPRKKKIFTPRNLKMTFFNSDVC